MSLRKTPERTPQLLEAARSNAQHSTGARSPAGQQHSKFNAVKHGERSEPENHYHVMRALGEDPAAFDALKQELRASFCPGDAFQERQVDDLTHLYWRRDRLERVETGLMRRALQRLEDWQHRRRQEIAGATSSVPQILDDPLTPSSEPAVQLRLLLSYLEVILAQVKQGRFSRRHEKALQAAYQGQAGLPQLELCHRLGRFGEWAEPGPGEVYYDPKRTQYVEKPKQVPRPTEEELVWLTQCLEAEIARVREEFEYAEKVNEEKVAIERDACLAPSGEEWKMLLRREETLDRSIDRKVKILLGLRKEAEKNGEGPDAGEAVGAPLVGARPGHDDTPEPAAPAGGHEGRPYTIIDERTGNVEENKGTAAAQAVEDAGPEEAEVAAEGSSKQEQQAQPSPAAQQV